MELFYTLTSDRIWVPLGTGTVSKFEMLLLRVGPGLDLDHEIFNWIFLITRSAYIDPKALRMRKSESRRIIKKGSAYFIVPIFL